MWTSKKIVSTCCKGFTLIELMLAMAISGIVLMAVFSIFRYQQQHYTAQLDVTEMQQNIRAALNIISRDIRMAGFDDPNDPVAQIVSVKPDLFYFTFDLNEDGDVKDPREHIAYDRYDSGDGIPTLGRTTNSDTIEIKNLGPSNWGVKSPAHQPAAEYIEHLNFYYLDTDGNPTTAADKVQTVVVTIVARAEQPDPRFKNTQTYTAGDGVTTWTKNDNYRRKMQILTVECRNVGL